MLRRLRRSQGMFPTQGLPPVRGGGGVGSISGGTGGCALHRKHALPPVLLVSLGTDLRVPFAKITSRVLTLVIAKSVASAKWYPSRLDTISGSRNLVDLRGGRLDVKGLSAMFCYCYCGGFRRMFGH